MLLHSPSNVAQILVGVEQDEKDLQQETNKIRSDQKNMVTRRLQKNLYLQ